MQQRNFQFCCGTTEVGNFGWEADLKAQVQQLRNLMQEARSNNKGLAICTTVSSQKGAVKLLKAEKFRVLRVFTNPNTSARVTLWGRETS